MGATRHTESKTQFFEVKHYCLWRQFKTQVVGCDSVEVTNPKTQETSTKYGLKFDDLSGRAVKLEWYDTEKKYSTRFIGFKLTLMDKGEKFVLDLPYKSRALQRLMMAANNIDWKKEIRFVAFKGKNRNTNEPETVFLIQQGGEWVKPFYTKDNPNGLPPAIHYVESGEWDFKAQLAYLARDFRDVHAVAIENAGREVQASPASQVEEAINDGQEPVSSPRGWQGEQQAEPFAPIDDDDVPF